MSADVKSEEWSWTIADSSIYTKTPSFFKHQWEAWPGSGDREAKDLLQKARMTLQTPVVTSE